MNNASTPQRIRILGIPIDSMAPDRAVAAVLKLLEKEGRHHVLTPNNEMLVEAQHNREFFHVLTQGTVNIPDSTGLVLAARMTGQKLRCRIPGVDFIKALCRELPTNHSVFLLGGQKGVSDRAAATLKRNNPDIAIAGTYAGSPSPEEADTIITRINQSGAHLLLVAFGAPHQDMWIAEHYTKLTSVRVAAGVGGTLDFLAGTVRRAPSVLRALGLEWLWRLILQPKRLPRIFTATIVFPLLVLRYGKKGAYTG